MVFFHERLSVFKPENAPFASDRLADEKRLGFRMIKTGGMKLDEFHVGDFGAGPIGHRQAVSRCDIGIGGDEINFTRAARA